MTTPFEFMRQLREHAYPELYSKQQAIYISDSDSDTEEAQLDVSVVNKASTRITGTSFSKPLPPR